MRTTLISHSHLRDEITLGKAGSHAPCYLDLLSGYDRDPASEAAQVRPEAVADAVGVMMR